MPTFNEALGVKHMVWSAWRFAAAPRGVPADRKRWLEAARDAALGDPELIAEYKKTGAIVERKFHGVAEIEAEIEKMARREAEFLRSTGRIK